MRRFFPDSIRGWVLLVVLGGLAVSHLVAFSLYSKNRVEAIATVGGRQVAGSVAVIAKLASQTARHERRALTEAASTTSLKFFIGGRPLVWEQGKERLSIVVRRGLGETLPPGTMVLVGKGEGGLADNAPAHMRMLGLQQDMMQVVHGAPLDQWVLGSVRLADGFWLNFAAHPEIGEGWWRPDFSLTLLAVSLVVVALIVVAARFATRSFAIFANAAQRLGQDIHAPPMREDGPREVRRAAQAFNEMQARLRRFIVGRTQMIAAISHDLRTPITRMRLRAADEEQRDKMLADLEEMENMIAETLAFARDEQESASREVFDLGHMLHDMCVEMATLGQNVAFSGLTSLNMFGHSARLKRVFANLIGNAMKYGDRARVNLLITAQHIEATIDDDGPGIPEDEREKVFAPFYRLEHSRSRETGGSGLGLASARNIVRGHGGEIKLATRAEGGLRVTVTLPRLGEK